MKLYHGSDKIIETPMYGYGKKNNDYGLGFYTAEDEQIGKLWANKNPNGGYLNSYSFDSGNLNVLSLLGNNKEDVLKWISLLVQHRFSYSELIEYQERINKIKNLFPVNIDGYDVIIGYWADDNYFSYARDFLGNDLSFEKISLAMKIGSLGKQVVLISRRAFQQIKFINAEFVAHNSDYENFRIQASNDYHTLIKEDSDNNTFIRDILRELK